MRAHSRVAFCLVLLGLTLTSLAAQSVELDKRVRYKWKDEQGNLHFEDSIAPEAARLGYDVVNPQGLVVKHVERAKSPEELAAAKLESDRVADEKRKAEDKQRSEIQMLAAYPSEDDLRRALLAQIEIITQNIQATELGIQSQEKSLAERLTHAADQERNGKPVPANVQQQIATLKKGLTDQKAFLERRTADRDAMQRQLENDVAHYRQLKRRLESERTNESSASH
ncbi:MAG: DUF4124 domain-containing protein [Tahibacter sp.]